MKNWSHLLLPLAIIVAGAFVGYGLYHSGSSTLNSDSQKATVENSTAVDQQQVSTSSITVAPVTDADHILGNKDAKVVLVEYSDTECPYCKNFFSTLEQISSNYGTTSNLFAWVYRPFPVEQLHEKSEHEAEAAECANELGGSTAFWNYLDDVYENTPSNDGLDPSELNTFADDVGVDQTAFTSCLSSGKYADKISESVTAGFAAGGGSGTPYSVLLVRNGNQTETVPLMDSQGNSLGSLSYSAVKALIDTFVSDSAVATTTTFQTASSSADGI